MIKDVIGNVGKYLSLAGGSPVGLLAIRPFGELFGARSDLLFDLTPQQLSREAIEEFRAIYQEEFGEILSDDEVQEIAMRLLRFFGILNKGK